MLAEGAKRLAGAHTLGRDPVGPAVTVVRPAVAPAAILVPEAWLLPCKAKRIIYHWTAGSYRPSSEDKAHYHFLIDGEGRVFRGDHPVSDNDDCSDDDYAAHTRGCNTGSIGVAFCGMAGAVESPFDAGPYPLKKEQWLVGVRVVARLCKRYGIAVTARTVLSHAEVEATLGIAQRGKWDVTRLAWEPALRATEVARVFRQRVIEGKS
jgi:hypothetical protein